MRDWQLAQLADGATPAVKTYPVNFTPSGVVQRLRCRIGTYEVTESGGFTFTADKVVRDECLDGATSNVLTTADTVISTVEAVTFMDSTGATVGVFTQPIVD